MRIVGVVHAPGCHSRENGNPEIKRRYNFDIISTALSQRLFKILGGYGMRGKILMGLLLLTVLIPAFAFAGTVQLPKTGQTVCYNAAGDVIDCATAGQTQDGKELRGVAWPSPRFTAGTGAEVDCVTDNLTGLMWAKNGNLPNGRKTWQQALDYVATTTNNGAGMCGHNDWRLPNVNELESLVHAGQADTSTWLNNATQEFNNVQAHYYWSSSSYAYSTRYAWLVTMYNGTVSYNNKSDNYYVWPVRAGQSGTVDLPKTGQTVCYNAAGDIIDCATAGQTQDGKELRGVAWPSPRFTAGTGAEVDCVTDNLTGLMWAKNGNLPNGRKTWQQALDYVATTTNNGAGMCGHNDWRLPNRKELRSLVNYSQSNPATWLNNATQGFNNVQAYYYWSSSSRASNTSYAWNVYMYHGGVNNGNKSSNSYVWPVRAGQ